MHMKNVLNCSFRFLSNLQEQILNFDYKQKVKEEDFLDYKKIPYPKLCTYHLQGKINVGEE